jgi:hypothetical protein
MAILSPSEQGKSEGDNKRAMHQPEVALKVHRALYANALRVKVASLCVHDSPLGVCPPIVRRNLKYVEQMDFVAVTAGYLAGVLIKDELQFRRENVGCSPMDKVLPDIIWLQGREACINHLAPLTLKLCESIQADLARTDCEPVINELKCWDFGTLALEVKDAWQCRDGRPLHTYLEGLFAARHSSVGGNRPFFGVDLQDLGYDDEKPTHTRISNFSLLYDKDKPRPSVPQLPRTANLTLYFG